MSASDPQNSSPMKQLLSRRISNQRLPYAHLIVLMAPAWWGMACSGSDFPPGGTGGSPGTNGGAVNGGGSQGGGSQGGSSNGGSANGGSSNGGSNQSGAPSTSGNTSTGGASGSSTGGVSNGGSSTGGKAATGGNGGGKSSTGGTSSTGGSGTGGKASTGGASSTGGNTATGGTGGASTGGATGDRATKEGVCARWKADRANMSEGTWSGNTASCDKGDISADGRANALRLYNLYRWLADLPAVVTDPTRDSQAQACALMQYANGSLSHTPPMTWKCYTEEGAKGSSSSNISGGPGVSSVEAYMVDNGNATTIGHRRWILSNSLGPIGLGSTGKGSSCMQNLNGTGKAGKPWMAWPPPGIVPIQAFGGRSTIDSSGWTVQSDNINLANATVTVTANGAAAAMTVTQLQGGYGSRYAFRMNPSGWKSMAGTTYEVSVTNIPTPISYKVEVVDCP